MIFLREYLKLGKKSIVDSKSIVNKIFGNIQFNTLIIIFFLLLFYLSYCSVIPNPIPLELEEEFDALRPIMRGIKDTSIIIISSVEGVIDTEKYKKNLDQFSTHHKVRSTSKIIKFFDNVQVYKNGERII